MFFASNAPVLPKSALKKVRLSFRKVQMLARYQDDIGLTWKSKILHIT